jgi:hypothetical protein
MSPARDEPSFPCPVCRAPIAVDLRRLLTGEEIACAGCGTRFELRQKAAPKAAGPKRGAAPAKPKATPRPARRGRRLRGH